MKIHSIISAAFASVVLICGTGCQQNTGQMPEEETQRSRMEKQLDEIQVHLMQLSEQISDIKNTPQADAHEPITLKPVVPVVKEPKARKLTKRERLALLAKRNSVTPAKSKARRSSSKRRRSKSSKQKKHIRVPVPVRTIQVALRNAGFNPGPIDGRIGERTIAAARAFQRSEGIKVDGIIGPATWSRLQRHVR